MKIKPCPFCGSEAVIYKTDSIYTRVYSIGCTGEKNSNCAGLHGSGNYEDRREAIKEWNKRVK